MMLRTLTLSCALASMATPSVAQVPMPTRPELYKFVTIQAAPGRLLDLIAAYRERAPVMAASGDEMPIVVRHSQGDRWDLLLIYPTGSFTDYYSKERIAKREAAGAASNMSNAAFQQRLYDLIGWHEDVFVWGPPQAELRAYMQGNTLAHLEMLQAMGGKHDELIKERYMESAFNVGRGRPAMLVFTHEQGAAWDVITLDAWKDWKHYGDLQAVPPDVSEAAAKKAGFASAESVGVYMRSLINTHHDTLGSVVSLTPR